MKGYTTSDVANLLGITESQVRAYTRSGVLNPERGARREYLYDFQDLVLLRTAAALRAARVAPRRIAAALQRLRAELPEGRSLTELRIRADGDDVVVSDGGRSWEPASGQLVLDFDVADLAAHVAPLARRVAAAAAQEQRSAEEWFELGLELEAVEPAEARNAYHRALELDPAHADAHVNLGRLLHEEGHASDAAAHYRQALLAGGPNATAAYNLGVALEDLRRVTDAMQAYERAIDADPAFAEAHYNLARLHEHHGDRSAALRHYHAYRDLTGKPDHAGL